MEPYRYKLMKIYLQNNKKLIYDRGTARRSMSVEILSLIADHTKIALPWLETACGDLEKSPLPLTDPRDGTGSVHSKYSVSLHMAIKPLLLLGLAAEYRSRRWVWCE